MVVFFSLGTSDEEMKKLMRLTKEKRKEEKVLQHLLKAKGMRGSPAVGVLNK